MPKPPTSPGMPGKYKPVSITDPTVEGQKILGTFDQFDLSGGRKVKDQNFVGDDSSQWVIFGAGNDTAQMGGADDIAEGNEGNDSLAGGAGNDYLFGGGGDDTIEGGDGGDTIEGGDGGDTLDGGANDSEGDTLSYAGSDAAVTVNLGAGTVSGGHADGDIISGFENILGSAQADSLTGDGGDNVIEGGAGADTIDGGAGGFDVVSYQGAAESVVLVGFTGTQGDAEGDLLSNIDGIIGSEFNDALQFSGNDPIAVWGMGGIDILLGGNQVDTLVGGEGADQIDGGRSSDVIDLTEDVVATDQLRYGPGREGIDQVTGFNANAPAAGGDRILIDFNTVDDPASLQESVDEGLTLISNVGGFVQLSFDIGGNGNAIDDDGLLLTDVAWPGSEADVIALLADNFLFI